MRLVDRDVCVVSSRFCTYRGIIEVKAFGRRLIILERMPLKAWDMRYRIPSGPPPGSWRSFHRARPSGTCVEEVRENEGKGVLKRVKMSMGMSAHDERG